MLGFRARREGAAAHDLEQRIACLQRVGGTGSDDAELSSSRKIGTAQNGRSDKSLFRLRVFRFDGSYRWNRISAHRQMDGPGRKRVAHATLPEYDFFHDVIFGEHSYDNIPAF